MNSPLLLFFFDLYKLQPVACFQVNIQYTANPRHVELVLHRAGLKRRELFRLQGVVKGAKGNGDGFLQAEHFRHIFRRIEGELLTVEITDFRMGFLLSTSTTSLLEKHERNMRTARPRYCSVLGEAQHPLIFF